MWYGNEPCVYFSTQTHNSEATLARAIESVLNQTHSNLKYFIIDNASSDGTRDIIAHYARLDSRIQPIYVEENREYHVTNLLPRILAKYPHDGFYTLLDHDDEYEPEYLKKLLSFMRRNELEIAACASAHLDGESGKDISKVSLSEDIIIEGDDFQRRFPELVRYFRDFWGVLIPLRLLTGLDYQSFERRLQCCHCVQVSFVPMLHTRKTGICAEKLHRYYVYPNSMSRNKALPLRMVLDEIYSYYLEFLREKCGYVSEENLRVLSNNYCNYILGKLSCMPPQMLSSEWNRKMVLKAFSCDFVRNYVIQYSDSENLRKFASTSAELARDMSDLLDPQDAEKMRSAVLRLERAAMFERRKQEL